MVILLKTASVWVSSIQIIQVRVQNKGKSVWKSRYDGDVSNTDSLFPRLTATLHCSNMQAHRFSSAGEISRNARAFRSIVSMLVKLTGSAPPPPPPLPPKHQADQDGDLLLPLSQ